MDQNGSNLIKLDFWWNNHWNTSWDFQLYLFFDQIESDLSKMDQNGSNLIKLNFWWNNIWNISWDFILYLSFDQIEIHMSKIDQNGSNLIKLDFYEIIIEIFSYNVCFKKIWTHPSGVISHSSKVYEWSSCLFAKMILPLGDHFGKRTAWSLIYFLSYG